MQWGTKLCVSVLLCISSIRILVIVSEDPALSGWNKVNAQQLPGGTSFGTLKWASISWSIGSVLLWGWLHSQASCRGVVVTAPYPAPPLVLQVQQEKRRKDTHLCPRAHPQPSVGAHAIPDGRAGSSTLKHRTRSQEGVALGANCWLEQKGKLMLGHQNRKWSPLGEKTHKQ